MCFIYQMCGKMCGACKRGYDLVFFLEENDQKATTQRNKYIMSSGCFFSMNTKYG